MSFDIKSILAQTELKNKDCVAKALKSQGVASYAILQNLPGRYGRPFLCGQGTHVIVAAMNEAITKAEKSIPSIEDYPSEPAALEEPKRKSPVVQETLLSEIELPGVHDSVRQKLADAGIFTVGEVLKDKGKHLSEVPGIGETTEKRIVSAVKAALEY
jgi:hypothetical protein